MSSFDTRQRASFPGVKYLALSNLALAECQIFDKRPRGFLPSVFCLPSVLTSTLGKEALCRVSDKKHSAKSRTLGKLRICGSEESTDESKCSSSSSLGMWKGHHRECREHSPFDLLRWSWNPIILQARTIWPTRTVKQNVSS